MLLKIKYLLLLCTLYHSLGYEFESYETSEECDTSFETENGTFENYTLSTTSVKFFLLTPDNETTELNSTNLALVNKRNPTKIIVHGLGSYENYTWIEEMARVYHTHGNYNVIAVDWQVATETTADFLVDAVDDTGRKVGTLIMEITQTDLDYLSQIHLIGASVGAQISGAAGETVANETDGKVGRITALSPGDMDVLDADDADFVDVIHTSVFVGERKLGSVDFYIIDGLDKPVCTPASHEGKDRPNSTPSTIGTHASHKGADGPSSTPSTIDTHASHKGADGPSSTPSTIDTHASHKGADGPSSTPSIIGTTVGKTTKPSKKPGKSTPDSKGKNSGKNAKTNDNHVDSTTHGTNTNYRDTDKSNDTHLNSTKANVSIDDNSTHSNVTVKDSSTHDDLCGELLASDLFIETIEDGGRFMGVSCYDDDDAIAKVCDEANSAVMGEHVSRNATGNYVVVKSAASRSHPQGIYIVSYALVLFLCYFTV